MTTKKATPTKVVAAESWLDAPETKNVEAAGTKKAKAKPVADGDIKTKKLSAINAAAKVLADSKTAMNVKEILEVAAAKNLWASPNGKTPHATLYSAIVREIAAKGKEARFVKTERGKFAFNFSS